MVRSRIKRDKYWIPDELVLVVAVECFETRPQSRFAYRIGVNSGRFALNPTDPSDFTIIVSWDTDYGSIGTSPRDGGGFIRSSVRDRVEAALADYLKANFDS